MAAYVWALHDFQPENEDEVPFRAGDRILVLERDDLYGDGWWKGKNPDGREGLFPASYTTPQAPPPPVPTPLSTQEPASQPTATDVALRSPSGGLESIREHDEPVSAAPSAPATSGTSPVSPEIPNPYSPAIAAAEPKRDPFLEEPGDEPQQPSPDEGKMMRATMTDVQMAIEQLGMRDRGDGSRSFSFASSRDDRSTSGTELDETDYAASEAQDEDEDGEWHRDARQRLAEKARRAAQREQREREREEARLARLSAPPIDVDISDESEPEEGETMHNAFYRRMLEAQDRADDDDARGAAPSGAQSESPQPTATRESFGHIPAPAASLYLPPDDPRAHRASTIYPPLVDSPVPAHTQFTEPAPAQPEDDEPAALPTPVSPTAALPPAPATVPLAAPIPVVSVQPSSSTSLAALAAAQPAPAMPVPQPATPELPAAVIAGLPSPAASSLASQQQKRKEATPEREEKRLTHPSEWTVDDVVDWLRSKGFDQGVCDKFTEQEITGDVLLELDANVLKSEIGIAAFGKRVRIANAIAELKRPPSVQSSEPDGARPGSAQAGAGASASAHSSPAPAHLAPLALPAGATLAQAVQTPASTAFSFVSSVPSSLPGSSPPHAGSPLPGSWFAASRHARNASDVSGAGEASAVRWGVPQPQESEPGSADRSSFVGLGLGVPVANGRGARPAQLALSPSDGALGARAISESQIPEEEEDRTAVSEGEAPSPEKSRRKFFGRSFDSALGDKKDGDALPSPGTSRSDSKRNSTVTTAEEGSVRSLRSRHSKKRSLDTAGAAARDPADKKSDRLSIFGGMGSISKSRKPAPRYSAPNDNAQSSPDKEKGQAPSILSGLYHGSSKRAVSGRPRTADSSAPDASAGGKRAVSASNTPATIHEKHSSTGSASSERRVGRDSAVLRKRTLSASEVPKPGGSSPALPPAKAPSSMKGGLKAGQSILEQIGTPDHNGWMRKKGERYNSWKMRYFVLKGPHLYCLRSNSKAETKIKGYVNITGYRIIPDENVDPGRYGFKIMHDNDKVHYFSSEEQIVIREWMKALMKATITRDYKKPVVSSVNIPTIPLSVAQTMNPAPRPPSPSQRDATQRALRRGDTSQLSTRDVQILKGIPTAEDGALPSSPPANPNAFRSLPSGFRNPPTAGQPQAEEPTTPRTPGAPPPRPMRESRRQNSVTSTMSQLDPTIIEWANSYLPRSLQITDTTGSICNGLQLLRLAEGIKGKPASPPVLDSAFPSGPQDDKLDGLFRLFDFLLDNDVRMGSVSINDVRQGRRDKIVQMLLALRQWEDKRRQVAESLGRVSGGSYGLTAPAGPLPWAGH